MEGRELNTTGKKLLSKTKQKRFNHVSVYSTTQVTTALRRRIQQRLSGASDSDVVSDVSDESGNNNSAAAVVSDDGCSLFSKFIRDDLAAEPKLPQTFSELEFTPFLFNISVINETAPTFFALLTSAPELFSGIARAVDVASSDIRLPTSPEQSANSSLVAMSADFMRLARDECEIVLNPDQTAGVVKLFGVVLPVYVTMSVECRVFNETIIEQAIEAADFSVSPFDLVTQLIIASGDQSLHASRLSAGIAGVIQSSTTTTTTAGGDAAAATTMTTTTAQRVRDEFLFIVNDFCGVPRLSDVTLSQLDEYLLDDLVHDVMSNSV